MYIEYDSSHKPLIVKQYMTTVWVSCALVHAEPTRGPLQQNDAHPPLECDAVLYPGLHTFVPRLKLP